MAIIMSSTCGICTERFNYVSFIPKKLPECGHIVCIMCLETIYKEKGMIECPFCENTINSKPSMLTTDLLSLGILTPPQGQIPLPPHVPKQNENSSEASIPFTGNTVNQDLRIELHRKEEKIRMNIGTIETIMDKNKDKLTLRRQQVAGEINNLKKAIESLETEWEIHISEIEKSNQDIYRRFIEAEEEKLNRIQENKKLLSVYEKNNKEVHLNEREKMYQPLRPLDKLNLHYPRYFNFRNAKNELRFDHIFRQNYEVDAYSNSSNGSAKRNSYNGKGRKPTFRRYRDRHNR